MVQQYTQAGGEVDVDDLESSSQAQPQQQSSRKSGWRLFGGGNNNNSKTDADETEVSETEVDPTETVKKDKKKNSSGPDASKKSHHRPGTGKKRSKPRHQNRRRRFRQGVFNVGLSLRVLEEGEEEPDDEEDWDQDEDSEFGETEQTTHVSGDDLTSAFKFKSMHGEGSCWGSRSCQLLLVACLLLIGGAVAVVFFVFGGFGMTSSSSSSEQADEAVTPPPEAAIDVDYDPSSGYGGIWEEDFYKGINFVWDPAVMKGPPLAVRELLPNFTLAALQDANSPQSLAVKFVEEHPAGVEGLPNWKKLQLVALAAFYYSFNGKDWPDDKRKDWLNYDVDECDWGDPGVEGEYLGVACTDPEVVDDGVNATNTRRFTDLNLDWFLGFGLVGFPDAAKGNEMPPEVIFLRELKSLGIMNAGLKANFTSLLPPTILDMPTLTRLSFRFNNIAGTIPDYLGAMTQLEYLSLGSNYLTGTLPAELGGLTELRELFLYSNQFVGSIPYHWHRLTQLREFSAISNQITGKVPAFVGDWLELEFFFIDHNPLVGDLPQEICQLPHLTSVLIPCTVECAMDCGDKCECY